MISFNLGSSSKGAHHSGVMVNRLIINRSRAFNLRVDWALGHVVLGIVIADGLVMLIHHWALHWTAVYDGIRGRRVHGVRVDSIGIGKGIIDIVCVIFDSMDRVEHVSAAGLVIDFCPGK